MMKLSRTVTSLLTLTLVCAGIARAQESSNHSATGSAYEPQQKVLILADNQEHLLTGVPLEANSPQTDDRLTSVALRSPLVNVGGRLLFREAIRYGRSEGAKLVLHLGDASDISCPDELSAVFNALDAEAEHIWFMTPGNHDGIRVGNYVTDQPTSHGYEISRKGEFYKTTPPVEKFKDAEETWLNACLSPTKFDNAKHADILTREDVIRRYVERLKSRPGVGEPEKLEPIELNIKGVEVRCEVEKFTIKGQGYTYTAIASICPRTHVITPPTPETSWVGPYASFILQRLDVGKTRIVMLDTSDYENPWLPYVAFTGDLSEAQKKLADSLFERDKLDRKNVIVIGHHPLKVFPKEKQQWIIERTGRYISAHTHYSTSKIKHGENDRKMVELNIGSTLDYPPQAVIANIGPGAMSFRVVGAKAALSRSGFLAPCMDEKTREKWMLRPDTLYTDYKSKLYVKHLLEALEAAVKIAPPDPALKIPTGDKADDWRMLETALQTINAAEGDARTFWACQAFYASEATKDEKSWWEKIPKLGFGFQRGTDATTDPDGWHLLVSP